MDAELLISKVRELQKKHGKNINVLVNHEEILMVVYMTAIPAEQLPEYINVDSVSSDNL